jgi:hypothetical protein
MRETEYKPTPEDKDFLDELGEKSEKQLSQNEMSYEQHLNLIRKIYATYQANLENNPQAVDIMIDQLKNMLVCGDNPPEKERAMRDFLREIGVVKK